MKDKVFVVIIALWVILYTLDLGWFLYNKGFEAGQNQVLQILCSEQHKVYHNEHCEAVTP